jgi:putative transposase
MQFEPQKLYHIYNRGNNSQKVFFTRENYLFFLKKIRQHLLPHCQLLAYCLLPNHFHFLIETPENMTEQAINQGIAIILRSYTQAINKQENRTGSLFQQGSKAKNVENGDANYPFICFQYIHQNPMAAKLVRKMEDWEFSSFKDYINQRNGTLCNKTLAIQLLDLPQNAEEFYKQSYNVIANEEIQHILV